MFHRFRLMRVVGDSMSPTFDSGELVVVDESAFNPDEPRRGELVAARPVRLGGKAIVKRVTGLPKERVECCRGVWQLGRDDYFVVGDCEDNSLDSRRLGPLKCRELLGRVCLQLWPPKIL